MVVDPEDDSILVGTHSGEDPEECNFGNIEYKNLLVSLPVDENGHYH